MGEWFSDYVISDLDVHNMQMSFEFDPQKAQTNWRKHHVRFEDAEPVFDDPMALTREDPDAAGEQRWLTVGGDALGRVLTVCYTLRSDTIRLISARLATKKERTPYES